MGGSSSMGELLTAASTGDSGARESGCHVFAPGALFSEIKIAAPV
jgi:hypothetical protein